MILKQFFRSWLRDPVGSLLTIVGVVLGSASLVFLASGLEGAGHAMASTAQRASGDDVVRIRPEHINDLGARDAPLLSPRDATALRNKESLPEEGASTGVTLYDREAIVGNRSMPVACSPAAPCGCALQGSTCCTAECSCPTMREPVAA